MRRPTKAGHPCKRQKADRFSACAQHLSGDEKARWEAEHCTAEAGDFALVLPTGTRQAVYAVCRCGWLSAVTDMNHAYASAQAHLDNELLPEPTKGGGLPYPSRFRLAPGVFHEGEPDERWVAAAFCPAEDGFGREVTTLREAWRKAAGHCTDKHGRPPWVPIPGSKKSKSA